MLCCVKSSTRKRHARGQGGLLRDEIVCAAMQLIDEAASEADVTLRRIARAAGIAAPSIYRHFQDRDAIIGAVIERSWEQFLNEIKKSVDGRSSPRDRLLMGCLTYVGFAQRFPLRHGLMTQATATSPAARQALDALSSTLAQCQPDRDPRPPAQELARITAALSVAMHGAAMLHRTDAPSLWISDISTDTVIRTIVDTAIDQLHTAASRPRRRH